MQQEPVPPTEPSPAAPRILVFDSGVGGLSIMQEIQTRIPAAEFIYASDNAAFPYGTKTEEELIVRVNEVMQALTTAYTIDIMVIACNTASTLTLPHLRRRFSQPIVGVVPAIKPAAALTRSGVIGLLATPATVARPYTHDLIREHAAHCRVISIGSSELVHIAEQKLRGDDFSREKIAQITQQLITAHHGQELDTLVLACTHFPLLRDEIAATLPHSIQLVDSGEAIARRVEFLLHQHRKWHDALQKQPQSDAHIAVFTQQTKDVERLAPSLAKFGINHIDYIF